MFEYIQGSACLSIGGEGFDIYVKEIDRDINLWETKNNENNSGRVAM